MCLLLSGGGKQCWEGSLERRSDSSSHGKRLSPKMSRLFFLYSHLHISRASFCVFFSFGRKSCSCTAQWIFVLLYVALNMLPLWSHVIFSNTAAAQSVFKILPQYKIKNISKPVAPPHHPLKKKKRNRSKWDCMHNKSISRGNCSLCCNITGSSRWSLF